MKINKILKNINIKLLIIILLIIIIYLSIKNKLENFESNLKPITKKEIIKLQSMWKDSIINISNTYKNKGDYVKIAKNIIIKLYGYKQGSVLFKPTIVKKNKFRSTINQALSYFVGGNVIKNGYDEDKGFAINNGEGWSNIKFNNNNIYLDGHIAIAMGTYDFTNSKTKNKITVEYTIGYKRYNDGIIRIFLHHSSIPYSN